MKNKILFTVFVIAALLLTVYAASANITPPPPPVVWDFDITSTPDTTATVGELYNYQIQVQGTNSNIQFTYGLVSGPSGMSVNPTSGLVSWTPSQTGIYSVRLSVLGTLDGRSQIKYQTYNLVVSNDVIPTEMFNIISTPDTTASLNDQYAYQMQVELLQSGVSMTYALVSGPSGMSVNQATGLVSWTPSQTGTYVVRVSATGSSGGRSQTKYQEYNLVVSESGSTPAGMLEITKVTVKVGGKRDTLTSPGTIDEEAELGDEIEIEVKIRNNFDVDNDDTIIRDIVLELSSDLDDADGLEEEISRLRAGDDDEMTVSFTLDADSVVPGDAPFDIDLDVEGETDDGDSYSDSWTITLDMDSKSRDLHILDVQVSPTSFKNCVDNRVRVNVEVRNIGSRDLADAAVKLKIPSLGIDSTISNIDLDTGDDDSYSGYITIPAGTQSGTYNLDVQAYPVRSALGVTDVESVDLTVLSCIEEDPGNDNDYEDEEDNGGTIIIPDVTVSGTPVSTAVGRRGIFDSDSPLYFVLVGLLILLLLIIIILLVVRMATRNY
ncbi:MAG: putative Ig domain-containing protein [Candidatus Nanoarchaeia archaeon]